VPFFLEPGYDEDKPYIESNRDRLVQKWGGTRGWEEQKRRHDLKGRGVEAGIPFFNLDRLAANTMASHRLIQHLGRRFGLAVSEAVYDCLNEYVHSICMELSWRQQRCSVYSPLSRPKDTISLMGTH
jgi:hypothetical protein